MEPNVLKEWNEKRERERGFHHSDAHKIAEELRHEGKGSEDPMYNNSKKNK